MTSLLIVGPKLIPTDEMIYLGSENLLEASGVVAAVNSSIDWHQIFYYLNGKLFWHESPKTGERNTLAGFITKKGYLRVKYKAKPYFGHRIIWEMFNGKIRNGLQIDHINGNKIDNRIENLRLASNSNNHMNRKKLKGTKCKYKGVSLAYGKYHASIKFNQKVKSLGSYFSELEAAKAYDRAALKLFKKYALTNKALFPEDFL